MPEIIIDDEFASLIPALTEDEYKKSKHTRMKAVVML